MADVQQSEKDRPPFKKHRGIPQATFLDNVDKYMKDENANAEVVLANLDEQLSKYKFMEANLVQKKNRLKIQLPEIMSTLDAVRHLRNKKDSSEKLETQYLLSDQLYVKAKLPPTDTVYLWLGANVMLEYDIEEANQLLNKNIENAEKGIIDLEDDIDFLKDQITTTEVNMARVYNWDVKRRQQLKAS